MNTPSLPTSGVIRKDCASGSPHLGGGGGGGMNDRRISSRITSSASSC